MAKATRWAAPDTETRQHGERTGLETPVVHAVNDASSTFTPHRGGGVKVNTISWPPGEYGRKIKTQRN